MVEYTVHHVRDFFNLRLSQKREIAEWLGVERHNPAERDFDYACRAISVAKGAGKLDELFARVAAFKAENEQ